MYFKRGKRCSLHFENDKKRIEEVTALAPIEIEDFFSEDGKKKCLVHAIL